MAQLEYDKYYHIYNRGNNRDNLFLDTDDYKTFLRLFEKYIYPIADIYSWVLMKNHFHILVRIKSLEEIGFYLTLNVNSLKDPNRFQTTMYNNLTESINNLTESAGPVRVVNTPDSNNLTESVNNLTESAGSVRVVNTSRTTNSARSDDSGRLKIPNPSRHFSHFFNTYSKYFNPKYHRTGALFESPFERIEIDSIEYLRRLVVYIHTNPVHHGFTDDFSSYTWSSYQLLISSKPAKLKRDEIIYWFNDLENIKYMHQIKINSDLPNEILLE